MTEIRPDEYIEQQQEQGNEIVSSSEDKTKEQRTLEPLALGKALTKHEEIQQSNDRSQQTIDSHRSRLRKFLSWLKVQGIDTTMEIEPRHFEDYRIQRSKNVAKITVKTHMDTIRVFVRNMEQYQAMPEGISEYVRSPSLEGNEGQRSDHLPIERGNKVLSHVRKYSWGTLNHVVFELWWAAGIRLGGVHSIDEKDFYPEKKKIELNHRPDEGTTLKNGKDGERDVSIVSETVRAIQDYLDNPQRPDTKDEFGRKPLLASPQGGRYSKGSLRNICYYLTLPCVSTGKCPHDKDPDTCDWRKAKNKSSQCPSSKAPHDVRSGTLTRQLKEGINPEYISERANVSTETLKEHYSELNEEEKMEARRQWFDQEFTGQEAEEKVFDED